MSARDWKAYNEALVRRGEILLDFKVMKGWRTELAEMNGGKEGARYEYPTSLISCSPSTSISAYPTGNWKVS